ncbi:ABC transporter substrate-binding protein [Rhizobium sp. ARZ01]|uniref:ABC transporter substrate-binding protein n=1 Tax=Rhizobium sp. ARZ01 TaxID=2769313 RepID=UPI00177CE3EC|nr:ABC transporter substrate-binding protein [Rhizobium sp. ARZ01]MBD9375425.1 ABC transporter substrate-binding protein [Rhizobium sp. ARZ01]
MMLHLRNKLVRRIMLAGAAVASISLMATNVARAELKEVKIGAGGSNFLDLSYYYLLLPGPLGYWEAEGYKVDVFPVSGSSEAAQQLAVDNLDFAQMSSSAIVQANTQHDLSVRAVVTNTTVGWGIAVKKDGPIRTVHDLKGKSVGIVSLSSGGIPLYKSFLADNGLDPDNDATLVATGVGAQALTALESDQVQGLMYWSSALVGFQNAGAELDILRDPSWSKLPDYTLATSEKTFEERPEMVEGIARGVAKAMVFAAANPDCARKIQWEHYPDTKPTGVSEEAAVAGDLAIISTLLREQANAASLNPNGNIAGVSVTAMGEYQDFLFDAGVLTKKVDPIGLVATDSAVFWTKVNNFDKAAIEAQAKECNF